MEYLIDVTISKQRLFFTYYNCLNICEIENYENIDFYIVPNFSNDWKQLFKYISFSTNEKDYEYYKIEDKEKIIIPKNLLEKKKIAFHFYGKNAENEDCDFRISTNFLILNMLGDS